MIEELQNLVSTNQGQMSYDEYEYIYNNINGNVLVFGLGNDSSIWTSINSGYTLFIENEKYWIDKIKSKLFGNYDIYYYNYNTLMNRWIEYVNNQNLLNILKIKFENKSQNEILYNTYWDFIIIDGPVGVNPENPGRMMPISTTSSLKYKKVVIHDCDRVVENVFTRIFFGNNFTQINKLRIYEK